MAGNRTGDTRSDAALDADRILVGAAAAEGTTVPSGASWIDGLRRLVDSAAAEGGLHTEGSAAMAAKLEGLVGDRLRAERLFGEHPAIRTRQLPVRFAVAGLARSGTTLLHRLLSCDPDVENLATWQAFHPVPAGRSEPATDPRRQATVAMIEQIAAADPDAMKIHPLHADAPEEEVFLLQPSFASMLFALTCPLPGYSRWLNGTDHTDAYLFALDLLRLNEWAAGVPEGRPRVMKSPQFVLDMALLTRLLPATTVVSTFRDPVDLVGSYCSVYASSRRRSTIAVDTVALGRERVEQLRTMADRAMAARTTTGPDRFVDVHYPDLVADPLGVVEAIYDRAGIDLSGPCRAAMSRWLHENPQGKAGRHSYDLADYGLDPRMVEETFADYIEHFGIRGER